MLGEPFDLEKLRPARKKLLTLPPPIAREPKPKEKPAGSR
jgi:hypothetical protein